MPLNLICEDVNNEKSDVPNKNSVSQGNNDDDISNRPIPIGEFS